MTDKFIQNYKNAFKCDKCPGSNDEDGCPVWLETIMTNTQTLEIKSVGQCGFQSLMKIVIDNTKASDILTENITSLPKRLVTSLNEFQKQRAIG